MTFLPLLLALLFALDDQPPAKQGPSVLRPPSSVPPSRVVTSAIDSISVPSISAGSAPISIPSSVLEAVRTVRPAFQPWSRLALSGGLHKARKRQRVYDSRAVVFDLDGDGVFEAVLLGLDHDTVSVVGVTMDSGKLQAQMLHQWHLDLDPQLADVTIISKYLDGAFTNRRAIDRGQPFEWVRYGGEAGTIFEWTRRQGRWVKRTYEVEYE